MKTINRTISLELQAMISHCQASELQFFCEHINLEHFPPNLHLFVELVGIDTTLKISLLTRRLRIPKLIRAWRRLGQKKPVYAILTALPAAQQERLFQRYRGSVLTIPTLAAVWNRTLRKTRKNRKGV